MNVARAFTPLLLLAIVSLVSACRVARAESQPTDARPSGDFTSIAASGSFDVDGTIGPATSVNVACSDGDVTRVSTKVEGGKLTIEDTRSRWRTSATCTVTVTTPKLAAVQSVGSGNTTVKGSGEGLATIASMGSGTTVIAEAKADTVTITSRGSGELRIDTVTANDIAAEAMGSGTMRLSGKSNACALTVRGSGQVDAKSLAAESAKVRVFGSGDVAARASRRADVETNGSGDVIIYGKPAEKSAHTHGSGTIRFAS
jgi:hypothetical protein